MARPGWSRQNPIDPLMDGSGHQETARRVCVVRISLQVRRVASRSARIVESPEQTPLFQGSLDGERPAVPLRFMRLGRAQRMKIFSLIVRHDAERVQRGGIGILKNVV